MMAAGEVRRSGKRTAILDKRGKHRWHELWEGNPLIARPGERYEATLQNGSGCRPYIASFDDTRWTFCEYEPYPAQIYFTAAERRFGSSHAGYVVIEPMIKAKASPNKFWSHWQEVVDAMPYIAWAQFGGELRGARRIPTATFRLACAVLENSLAYVGPEGGLHHAAAAVGIPAVVIFGGFVSPAQTGYTTHRNLFTGGEPCGMRIPCNHCRDAMDRITPAMVINELESLR